MVLHKIRKSPGLRLFECSLQQDGEEGTLELFRFFSETSHEYWPMEHKTIVRRPHLCLLKCMIKWYFVGAYEHTVSVVQVTSSCFCRVSLCTRRDSLSHQMFSTKVWKNCILSLIDGAMCERNPNHKSFLKVLHVASADSQADFRPLQFPQFHNPSFWLLRDNNYHSCPTFTGGNWKYAYKHQISGGCYAFQFHWAPLSQVYSLLALMKSARSNDTL